jgi:hypothetical protein
MKTLLSLDISFLEACPKFDETSLKTKTLALFVWLACSRDEYQVTEKILLMILRVIVRK